MVQIRNYTHPVHLPPYLGGAAIPRAAPIAGALPTGAEMMAEIDAFLRASAMNFNQFSKRAGVSPNTRARLADGRQPKPAIVSKIRGFIRDHAAKGDQQE